MANRNPDGTDSTNSGPKPGSSFKDPTADVSYTSSDGVVFKLHRKHIEVNAPNLPLPDLPDGLKPGKGAAAIPSIALTEPATVLDLLFNFIRPLVKQDKNLPPVVSEIEDHLLFEVAEASEKYGVFSALNVCLIHMKQLVRDKRHALQIVNFADRQGYKSLEDSAAVLCLSYSYTDLVRTLISSDLLRRFLLFRDQYVAVKNKGLTFLEQNVCPNCSSFNTARISYFTNVNRDLARATEGLERNDFASCSNRYSNCLGASSDRFLKHISDSVKSLKGLSEITL